MAGMEKMVLTGRWGGERVQRLRRELGLTQPQMAAAVGVKYSMIRTWEQSSHWPGPEACARLDRLEAELARKLVNCAGCAVEMLGESMVGWLHALPPAEQAAQPALVAGRREGRPYCGQCLGEGEEGTRGSGTQVSEA
jgi:transcriptional regulator with XRE-family HTH domain